MCASRIYVSCSKLQMLTSVITSIRNVCTHAVTHSQHRSHLSKLSLTVRVLEVTGLVCDPTSDKENPDGNINGTNAIPPQQQSTPRKLNSVDHPYSSVRYAEIGPIKQTKQRNANNNND